MRPCDIDTKPATWTYTPMYHKTSVDDKPRIVPLGPQARKIVEKYLVGRRLDKFLFSPAEAVAEQRAERNEARKTPLSCGNKPGTNRKENPVKRVGDRYDSSAYRHAIQQAIKVANRVLPEGQKIQKWHPYQIRHTIANFVTAQYGEQAAKNFMGHSTLETLRRHYLERDLRQAVEVAKKMG